MEASGSKEERLHGCKHPLGCKAAFACEEEEVELEALGALLLWGDGEEAAPVLSLLLLLRRARGSEAKQRQPDSDPFPLSLPY